jgi:hypothetical protein
MAGVTFSTRKYYTQAGRVVLRSCVRWLMWLLSATRRVLARSSSKEWLEFAVKILPMRAMTAEERKRLVDEVVFTSPKAALEFVSENRQHLDPADVNAVTSYYVNTIARDMCLQLTHRNTNRQTDYFSDAQIAIFVRCAQGR